MGAKYVSSRFAALVPICKAWAQPADVHFCLRCRYLLIPTLPLSSSCFFCSITSVGRMKEIGGESLTCRYLHTDENHCRRYLKTHFSYTPISCVSSPTSSAGNSCCPITWMPSGPTFSDLAISSDLLHCFIAPVPEPPFLSPVPPPLL
jgi:hypothetical protein